MVYTSIKYTILFPLSFPFLFIYSVLGMGRSSKTRETLFFCVLHQYEELRSSPELRDVGDSGDSFPDSFYLHLVNRSGSRRRGCDIEGSGMGGDPSSGTHPSGSLNGSRSTRGHRTGKGVAEVRVGSNSHFGPRKFWSSTYLSRHSTSSGTDCAK